MADVPQNRLDRAVEAMRAADACGGDAGGTIPHRGRALVHADVCSACAGFVLLAGRRFLAEAHTRLHSASPCCVLAELAELEQEARR